MLTSHEIESLRRSHAMAPLAPSAVTELIESCRQLVEERDLMAGILTGIPESFAEVRIALNKLHGILGSERGGSGSRDKIRR